MKDKKVIQVGGNVRSGTTVHGLIIANRDGAIMLGEVMNLFRPIKDKHLQCINMLKKDNIWNTIIEDGESKLYENVFKYFPDIDLIVDTSKDPFWYKDQIEYNKKLEIKQILVYKKIDELNESFLKRGSRNMERSYYRYNKMFFSLFPEIRTSYTKDFIYNLEFRRTVQKYLEIDILENNLNYWNKIQPNFFGSQTVKQEIILKENLIDKTKRIKFLPKLELVLNELELRLCNIENYSKQDGNEYSKIEQIAIKYYRKVKNKFI